MNTHKEKYDGKITDDNLKYNIVDIGFYNDLVSKKRLAVI